MNDIGIQDSIGRLLNMLRLDGVQVEVEEGIVYLEGVVESATNKQFLETLIRHIQGVRSVVNCLAAVAAYDKYSRDCEQSGDTQARELFEQIKRDDAEHARQLRAQLKDVLG